MNHMQQQNPLEFLKWIPVQGEKYLGIAVVRFERRFIFRFKVMPSDHGGLWATTASLKTGVLNGKDKYDNAFELDSSYENDAMKEFVIQNVEMIQQGNRVNPNQQGSVFQAQQQAQPNQNYGGYPQQQQQASYNAPQSHGMAQAAPTSLDETLPF